MERSVFSNAIMTIFSYYDYKPPTESRMRQVFEKVKNIPNDAVDWIVEQITDLCETPPRNLAKSINEYWLQWLQSRRAPVDQYEKKPCRECGGDGYIPFLREMHGIKYRQIALCSACDNWRAIGFRDNTIPRMNRNEIESKGWSLFNDISEAPF